MYTELRDRALHTVEFRKVSFDWLTFHLVQGFFDYILLFLTFYKLNKWDIKLNVRHHQQKQSWVAFLQRSIFLRAGNDLLYAVFCLACQLFLVLVRPLLPPSEILRLLKFIQLSGNVRESHMLKSGERGWTTAKPFGPPQEGCSFNTWCLLL